MLTLRTTFSVCSRFYVIQGSSVRQTLFKKETACHGIDRHKLPTKRCTLRQIAMVMTQWWKNACHIKDWNLNRRLSNISLFEIKLEDIEDILNIIKLKKKYNYKCELSISVPSGTYDIFLVKKLWVWINEAKNHLLYMFCLLMRWLIRQITL